MLSILPTADPRLALLGLLAEWGADEAILATPLDRLAPPAADLPPATPDPAARQAAPPQAIAGAADPVAEARAAAAAAADLDALAAAMAAYQHCDLRRGARNLVFADGRPGARVMLVGEAPGREEDLEGRPFVGRAGRLLDRMFAAIGLSRSHPDPGRALYITNVLPWRPPQNREPTPAECAMMLPFLSRHVALAAPEIVVLMGNTPCGAVLGQRGITRLRGRWTEAWGRPCLPMFHPAYLLRNPAQKREAWADLLDLADRLEEAAP